MEIQDKAQFVQMLTDAMAAYGKPLPAGSITAAWWSALQAYPLRIVGAAFADYCDSNGEFAPVPAGIAMRCKTMDGRPGAEEAWAIALTSRDEADTVVWTAETAEAFALCQPVLEMGDEVGARMAFKEAYARIVAKARSEHKPAQWSASLGWDVAKREAVLQKASVAGLLAAPVVAGLLPPPEGSMNAGVMESHQQQQVAKIKRMMAEMDSRRQQEGESWAQQQRNATADAKVAANAMVSEYQGCRA